MCRRGRAGGRFGLYRWNAGVRCGRRFANCLRSTRVEIGLLRGEPNDAVFGRLMQDAAQKFCRQGTQGGMQPAARFQAAHGGIDKRKPVFPAANIPSGRLKTAQIRHRIQARCGRGGKQAADRNRAESSCPTKHQRPALRLQSPTRAAKCSLRSNTRSSGWCLSGRKSFIIG